MKHADLLNSFRDPAPADDFKVGDILAWPDHPGEYVQVTEVTADGWKMKPMTARHALMQLAERERLQNLCGMAVENAQRIKAVNRAFREKLTAWPDSLMGWAEPVYASSLAPTEPAWDSDRMITKSLLRLLVRRPPQVSRIGYW